MTSDDRPRALVRPTESALSGFYVVAALMALVIVGYGIFLLFFHNNTVPRDVIQNFLGKRANYDSLVTLVTATKPTATQAQPQLFEIARDRNPNRLISPPTAAYTGPQDAVILLAAWRDPSGRLYIRIWEYMSRHGGRCSLVWSTPGVKVGEELEPGDEVTPIDANWSVIWNGND